ncbi:MAG TPA: DUF1579 family protein [Bacteroidales bacterium]|nr:DUF1579 family protein [Bacteroidales bacterium]
MKKSMILIAAASSFLWMSVAKGQDKMSDPSMMTDKPDIVKKVMSLEGNWEGKLTQKMGDQMNNVTDMISFQSTAGDHGLLVTETMDTPDHKTYSATHLVGYDPVAKQLHWYLIDNMGGCVDNVGNLVDPNHLQLTSENTVEGKTTRGVVNLVWQNDDQNKFDLTVTVNGQVKESSQGNFRRTGSMR